MIGSAKSPGRVAAFFAAEAGVLILPWLFARFATPHRGARVSDRWLALLHTWTLAGLLLAIAIGVRSEQGLDLTRDPLLNIALTLGTKQDVDDVELLERARRRPRGASVLLPSESTKKKNVVIILLESTGAWATSLYGGPHATTPFLDELAKKAIVVDGMHAVEPHTTKALATTLCGIEPRPGIGIAESVPGGILGKCLPDLLRPFGYRSALFQAATGEFEDRPQLVRNMGFDLFTSGDELKHEGLKKSNYFGYEDRILVEPLAAYVTKAKADATPFVLAVLTNQAHHDYLVVKTYGYKQFNPEVFKNRYLNAVRYDDFMLRDLFGRFESAGILNDTIFFILGDHGEGFGEHGRYAHDDTIYEEGLHIPLIIYEPGGTRPPGRRAGLYNELDVTPTVLDMLGYRVAQGSYVGRSIFADGPERVLYAACYNDDKCLARFEGSKKLVHHFDRQRDELFDLAQDPSERKNLAASTRRESRPCAKTWSTGISRRAPCIARSPTACRAGTCRGRRPTCRSPCAVASPASSTTSATPSTRRARAPAAASW